MRANEALRLVGERVALVPYRAEHVATYSAWMASPELLAATVSERLSLEEEYENCESWRTDEHKCTFIVCVLRDSRSEEVMVGDVNLFLNDAEDATAAEIEVMVAVASVRRGGLAREALKLLQSWASGALGLRRFVAKIGVDNAPSLALFQSLGYLHVSTSSVFQEARCHSPPGTNAVRLRLTLTCKGNLRAARDGRRGG